MSDTFAAPISEQIWNEKYRHVSHDGTAHDATVQGTWRRIARELASVEKDPAKWEEAFYSALEGFKFLPAGRITAGAGTGRNVTLINCFVNGTIPDSMSGIFDMLKEAALTMQAGGGIGYDFSTLRPKGAWVKGVDADASGPLSFMAVWDAMCRTVMSAGSRRGAMMATMRCDHPDIEAFIAAKQDGKTLRMFNLSVLVTDAFMQAVKDGASWELVFGDNVYRTISARDLWQKIMRATYDYAEPGVIFIDRINDRNPLKYCETISCSNPCGEQPLPSYGSCLLGSINLARLTQSHGINWAEMSRVVRLAIRMMDNVVDVSRYPLDKQREQALQKRRLGLGVTGFADALAIMGLTYGSDEAVEITDKIMKEIALVSYQTSIDLAREKGSFPAFDPDQYYADTVPELAEDIKRYGLRNSHLTSVAPTGTISLYAGNISSGIEPIFAHAYDRKVLEKDGSHRVEEVVDYAVAQYRLQSNSNALPSHFVTAQNLTPADHVRMQAAAQKWVDSAISKTVNVPVDISFDDLSDVYMQAWDMGCKGCTTYRPNAVTGSVLTVSDDATGADDASEGGACAYNAETGEKSCA
jgi:ribonucleoside-diphosphate reductase alpha chain